VLFAGTPNIFKNALSFSSLPKGTKVADRELKAVNIKRDAFHGEWDYTINPNHA